MKRIEAIRHPELASLASLAEEFLATHAWCTEVREGFLAWGAPGVLAVFLFRVTRADADDREEGVWVVVGDLPPAYIACDDTPSWPEALGAYACEMQRWVDRVRAGGKTNDLVPVNAPADREHADMLEDRLRFIRDRILAADPDTLESER